LPEASFLHRKTAIAGWHRAVPPGCPEPGQHPKSTDEKVHPYWDIGLVTGKGVPISGGLTAGEAGRVGILYPHFKNSKNLPINQAILDVFPAIGGCSSLSVVRPLPWDNPPSPARGSTAAAAQPLLDRSRCEPVSPWSLLSEKLGGWTSLGTCGPENRC